jgi:hypothetical protein
MSQLDDLGLNKNYFATNSILNPNHNPYTTYQDFDTNYEGVGASKITSGNIKGVVDLGNNNPQGSEPFIRFDGTADRVLYNDGTTNRFFFGNNNGTAAVKLSQAGNDVLTATDDKLIWSSDFNSFKIVKVGTITVSISGVATQAQASSAHNLGYIPSSIGYISQGGTYFGLPYSGLSIGGATLTILRQWSVATDATNTTVFYTRGTSVSGDESFDIKYYCLREIAT